MSPQLIVLFPLVLIVIIGLLAIFGEYSIEKMKSKKIRIIDSLIRYHYKESVSELLKGNEKKANYHTTKILAYERSIKILEEN